MRTSRARRAPLFRRSRNDTNCEEPHSVQPTCYLRGRFCALPASVNRSPRNIRTYMIRGQGGNASEGERARRAPLFRRSRNETNCQQPHSIKNTFCYRRGGFPPHFSLGSPAGLLTAHRSQLTVNLRTRGDREATRVRQRQTLDHSGVKVIHKKMAK